MSQGELPPLKAAGEDGLGRDKRPLGHEKDRIFEGEKGVAGRDAVRAKRWDCGGYLTPLIIHIDIVNAKKNSWPATAWVASFDSGERAVYQKKREKEKPSRVRVMRTRNEWCHVIDNSEQGLHAGPPIIFF
ncbi:hypothetical protein PIB30_009693 [Stylosanthes scabra]|uniref:Uncharacterized protein n=1 Tax=Stylosanthes scabra TaxID=79078 RepID=A0ABU6V7Q8_9FABA|nr:hypothetical protein [Stylosanthes scabra]